MEKRQVLSMRLLTRVHANKLRWALSSLSPLNQCANVYTELSHVQEVSC